MKAEKMLKMLTVTGLVLALSAPVLRAQEGRADTKEKRGQFSAKDYKFITQTARGGISEVELGELARVKGVNTSVRNFGERMVTDHTKANNELKQLAASKQAALPVELSRKERSDMDHLQKATGKDFDKAYASDMVKDHKKDLKEFQDAAKDLDDPDLRAFAQKMVPTLEEHLRMARDMEELVKK